VGLFLRLIARLRTVNKDEHRTALDLGLLGLVPAQDEQLGQLIPTSVLHPRAQPLWYSP
jgi:hypothetical protein